MGDQGHRTYQNIFTEKRGTSRPRHSQGLNSSILACGNGQRLARYTHRGHATSSTIIWHNSMNNGQSCKRICRKSIFRRTKTFVGRSNRWSNGADSLSGMEAERISCRSPAKIGLLSEVPMGEMQKAAGTRRKKRWGERKGLSVGYQNPFDYVRRGIRIR